MRTFLLSLAGTVVGLFVFLVLLAGLLIGLIGAVTQGEPDPERIALTLDLRAEYADQAPVSGFAALSGEIGFVDVVSRIAAAAGDESVKALYLRAAPFGTGSARAEELRDAIQRFRAAGKPVIAHTQGSILISSPSSYRAIAAANEIWLQPDGELSMTGVAFESVFLADLLERIDVTADILKFGDYKTAPNTYTETDYTPAHRESLAALGETVWRATLDDIAADRKIEPDRLRAALEAGPIPAEEARSLGLVDQLGWPEDAREAVKAAGDDLTFLDIGKYTPPPASVGAPKIALIGGEGPILEGPGESDPFASTIGFGSDRVAESFLSAMRDEDIQAIVFRVDSPGGSPTASDQIWNAMRTAQDRDIPVVVSMGSVAASGGYYVAAGADRIVANRSTITGSIGVYGGKLAISEGLRRIGVNSESLTIGGSYTDAFSLSPFSDEQRDTVRQTLQRTYDRFVSVVADGRGLSDGEIRAVAEGRVWSGADALEKGLVDELGGYLTALDVARELAGIDPDAEVRLVPYPARRRGLEALDEVFGASAESARALSILSRIAEDPRVSATLSELEGLQSGRVQARADLPAER